MKKLKFVSDIDYEGKLGELSAIEAALIADDKSFLGPRVNIASRVAILTYFFSLCFFACLGFVGVHVVQSQVVTASTCLCISALIMSLVLSKSAWTYSSEVLTKIESYDAVDRWHYKTFKGLALTDGTFIKPHILSWLEIERLALMRCMS